MPEELNINLGGAPLDLISLLVNLGVGVVLALILLVNVSILVEYTADHILQEQFLPVR